MAKRQKGNWSVAVSHVSVKFHVRIINVCVDKAVLRDAKLPIPSPYRFGVQVRAGAGDAQLLHGFHCNYTTECSRSGREWELSLVPARVLSIASSANQTINTCFGQSQRRIPPAPMATPERSPHLGGQRWILGMQPRDIAEHERHPLTSFRRLYFFQNVFPPNPSLAIVPFWPGELTRRTNRPLRLASTPGPEPGG